MNMWNVHRETRNTRNWFRYETFYYLLEFKVFRREENTISGTKLFITILSLRLFDVKRERERERESERERHTHTHTISFYADFSIWPPPRAAPAANFWSSFGELRKSTCFVQAQISTTCFFSNSQNPQPGFRAWRHLHPRFRFYLRFLLWHLWLSHPPCARVITCAQCVNLTNPCTKRKVLSLTKPKGKIYKTKSLRNYITLRLSIGNISMKNKIK